MKYNVPHEQVFAGFKNNYSKMFIFKKWNVAIIFSTTRGSFCYQ